MNQSSRSLIQTPLMGCQNTELPKQKVINKRLNIEMDRQSNLPLMDDDGDKQALHRRRHSRGFSKTIQLKQKTSEQAAAANPKWTPDQLYSHYSQCMKLSQENKINHKNAFELHLIDHMQQFIHKDGSTNFLVAGGTIYAGAKIYASRVDAIGTLLNRLILSLASGGKDDEEEGVKDGDADGDNIDLSAKPKPRRKKRNCQVLETHEANLRVAAIPQMCLANLIQRREGRSVDAANCSYLATNQYKPCEDEVGIKYVEESNEKLLRHDHDFEDVEKRSVADENMSDKKGNLFTQLSSYINNLNTPEKKRLKNVDSLTAFDFDSMIPSYTEQSHNPTVPKNPFAEDLEAAAIDRVDGGDSNSIPFARISDDDDDMDLEFAATPADDDDSPSILQTVRNEFSETAALDIGRDTLEATTSDALDPARLVALQPGEYSFFKNDSVSSYEGPDSWLKMKNAQAAALKKLTKVSSDGPPTKKRRAPLKAGIELKQPKIAGLAGKASLQKMTAAKKEQMRDNKRSLATLEKCEISKADLLRAMQVRVYIRPLQSEYADKLNMQQVEQDDLAEAINHTNTDFCPPINLDGGEDNNNDDDDHHDDDDDECPIFSGNTSGLDKTEYEDMLEGDHLVEGPRKVELGAKLHFGNVAKRMDVKKLKEALWKDLRDKVKKRKEANLDVEEAAATQQEAMNCEEPGSRAAGTTDDKHSSHLDYIPEHTITPDDILFSQTYSSLPEKLSSVMRESLSIPIAFTCLLHLANEKQLEIQSLPCLTDVLIKLPSTTNTDNLGNSKIKNTKGD